jgi:glycosyltransferase involved in cell wall biosynthesis
MESFVQRNNLTGIRIHGYQLPGDGYQIIARCHIGLAVLMPVPNAIQSYPTKMFEYMALGLPVIVSGFPLYREVVENAQCGLCLNDPAAPHELAEAIRWLLDHPQEAIAMGKQGQEAVTQHYNWEVEAEKLCLFYRQLRGESGDELNNVG